MAFTVENLASAVRVSDVVLSPDATKLVYRTSPTLKNADDNSTAALWYTSDLSKADSAKQITSGLFSDGTPYWHPDGKTIYFLSDRHSQGGASQIYKLSLDGPGEASLLNDLFKEKKHGVHEFQISPDGKYIAFSSADESTPEQEKKDNEKDDPTVWGDTRFNSRLRLYTIGTGTVRTLVEKDNIIFFTWSPDSKNLAFSTAPRPEIEAYFDDKTTLYTVSIMPTGTEKPTPKRIFDIEQNYIDQAIWPFDEDLFFVQTFTPGLMIDCYTLHKHSLATPIDGAYKEKALYGGVKDDVDDAILIGSPDEFAVIVGEGMDTRVDIMNKAGETFTLYSCKNQAGTGSLDVKKVKDGYVIAVIRSSAPDKEPPTVWVGKTETKSEITLSTKLSSHYPWVSDNKLGAVEIFKWEGKDGMSLDGMAWFPEGQDSTNVKTPLPTVIQIHGGPYGRDYPQLALSWRSWSPYLAEKGYLVLQPNYRGGAGRGSEFARAAYHAMGTIEWSDVEGMVDEAVKRGLADKDKLGICGWSQGGFLTAWGISQTKNKFKCGVMGAGVSDWGSMTTESDVPDIENSLGGGAPWIGMNARLEGDPIRFVEGVESAVLIIHGERDNRVPVGQAIGFHRGLRRKSKYPDRHILVTYPREGHLIGEKKHGEDILRRVADHFEAWLK